MRAAASDDGWGLQCPRLPPVFSSMLPTLPWKNTHKQQNAYAKVLLCEMGRHVHMDISQATRTVHHSGATHRCAWAEARPAATFIYCHLSCYPCYCRYLEGCRCACR